MSRSFLICFLVGAGFVAVLRTPIAALPGPFRTVISESRMELGEAEYRALRLALERPVLFRGGAVDLVILRKAEELVRAHAPRIWFHASDEGPSDPLHFLASSSLWSRRRGYSDQLLSGKGRISPVELVRHGSYPGPARPGDSATGHGVYLKLERNAEKTQRGPAQDEWGGAPLLWKLGSRMSVGSKTREDLLLLEYWFHADYSKGPLGIGNHQGDWEGVAALVQVDISNPAILTHRLVAMYFSAHEGGSWRCARDLNWTLDNEGRRRPEAFSALGTHATYPKPGMHWNKIFPEVASRGRYWDSWKEVRPLALEPYFGFTGGWGDVGHFAFTSGPMPPGSEFKSMPRASPSRWLKSLEKQCSITPISSSPALK